MQDAVGDRDTRSVERDDSIAIFQSFVEIYKHHFDLFVKGYSVYLAIIGVSAGFIFKDGAAGESQRYLSLFICVVSAMGVPTWLIGVLWVRRLMKQVHELCDRVGSPRIEVSGFQTMVFIGWVGSLVLTAGSIIYYARST